MACICMQVHPHPYLLLARECTTQTPFTSSSSASTGKLGAPVMAVQQQVQQAPTSTRGRSRRPENAVGDFFVDHTCIDCDTCRWMAPETFNRQGEQSAVYSQPSSSSARVAALQALLSCPTSSIRTEKAPADILNVQETFPLAIDEEHLPVWETETAKIRSFGEFSSTKGDERGGNGNRNGETAKKWSFREFPSTM